MAAMSQYNNSEIKKLKEEKEKLLGENKRLQEELEFYKSISNHSNALVGNMYVKYIDGKKVWVNRQDITQNRELLNQLDKDSDVSQWLEDINIKFKDRDW